MANVTRKKKQVKFSYQYVAEIPRKSYAKIIVFLSVMLLLGILFAFLVMMLQAPPAIILKENHTFINITNATNATNTSVDFAKKMSIETISLDSILLRNAGPVIINPDDFSLYINGTKQVCRSWTMPMNPHAIRVCHLSSRCYSGLDIILVTPGNTTLSVCP